MKNSSFGHTGIMMPTPFCGGSIDYDSLLALIESQTHTGADALFFCGTAGEGPALDDEEKRALIRFAVAHCRARFQVYACTGSSSTRYAADLGEYACAAGADGLMVVTPYYNKASADGLVRHFTWIADRAARPVIISNIPARTGVSCTLPVYHALSRRPGILGVKEASGDHILAARTIEDCGDDLLVWSGNDDQIVPFMALGAEGVISVAGALWPQGVVQAVKACLAGDYRTAAAIQRRMMPLVQALFLEPHPIPLKAAMEWLGLLSGELRLPLCPMEEENRRELIRVLEVAGLNAKHQGGYDELPIGTRNHHHNERAARGHQ